MKLSGYENSKCMVPNVIDLACIALIMFKKIFVLNVFLMELYMKLKQLIIQMQQKTSQSVNANLSIVISMVDHILIVNKVTINLVYSIFSVLLNA